MPSFEKLLSNHIDTCTTNDSLTFLEEVEESKIENILSKSECDVYISRPSQTSGHTLFSAMVLARNTAVLKLMLSNTRNRENLIFSGVYIDQNVSNYNEVDEPFLSSEMITLESHKTTTIHLACRWDHLEVLKCLMEGSQLGTVKDDFVHLPCHHERQFFEVSDDDGGGKTPVEIILEKVKIGKTESIPLLAYLIKSSSNDVFLEAVAKTDFKLNTLFGRDTILKLAIFTGNYSLAQALLSSEHGVTLLTNEIVFSPVVNVFIDENLGGILEVVLKMKKIPQKFVKAALDKCGASEKVHSEILKGAVLYGNSRIVSAISDVCDYKLILEQLDSGFEELSHNGTCQDAADVLQILLLAGCEKYNDFPENFNSMVTTEKSDELKIFQEHGTILHIASKGLMSNVYGWIAIKHPKALNAQREAILRLALTTTFQNESIRDASFLSLLLGNCCSDPITNWQPILSSVSEANVNNLLTQEKVTLLFVACQVHTTESKSLVEYLLSKLGAKCDIRTATGDTALTALWYKIADGIEPKGMLRLLLDNGADVNARNSKNESALHHSLQFQSSLTRELITNRHMELSTVKAALYPRVGEDSAIDPFKTFPLSDKLTGTILHLFAQEIVSFDVIRATRYLLTPFTCYDVLNLLKCETSQGSTALDIACREGRKDLVALLMATISSKTQEWDITSAINVSMKLPSVSSRVNLRAEVLTILLECVMFKDKDLVRNVVSEINDLNTNFGEWPLLCMAAEAGNEVMVSLLLDQGVNTSVSGPQGTALHSAVRRVRPDIVTQLLSGDFMTDECVTAKHDGMTAVSVAAQVYKRFEEINGISSINILMDRHLAHTGHKELLLNIISTENKLLKASLTTGATYEPSSVVGATSNLIWMTSNSPFLTNTSYKSRHRHSPDKIRHSMFHNHSSCLDKLLSSLEHISGNTSEIAFVLYGCEPNRAFEMLIACVLYTIQEFHVESGIQRVTTNEECSVSELNKVVEDLRGFLLRLPKHSSLHHFYRGTEKKYLPRTLGGEELNCRFMSTSHDINSAMVFAFQNQCKPALLMGHTYSAGDIEGFSVYREGELLIPPTCKFKLQWVMSPTLMRMSCYRFYKCGELMVNRGISCAAVSEIGGNTDSATREQRSKNTLQMTKEITQEAYNTLFGGFLGTFIPNDMGLKATDPDYSRLLGKFLGTYIPNNLELVYPRRSAVTQDDLNVQTVLEKWLNDDLGKKEEVALCFEGDPGVGKTSAALKAMTYLNEQNYFTLFIPLPKVTNVFGWGAIDDYVAAHCIGLMCELEDLHANAESLKPILVLESLDEIPKSEIESTQGQVHNLRLRNSTLLKYACIVTTRSDFLSRLTNDPSELFGDVRCYRLLPFNTTQRRECCKRSTATELTKDEVAVLSGQTQNSDLENPYVLSITLEAMTEIKKRKLSLSAITDMDILDAYLHQNNERQLQELKNVMASVGITVRQLLCRIACLMLYEGVWEGKFFDFLDNFLLSSVQGCIEEEPLRTVRQSCGNHIAFFPFRTENEDTLTIVGFSHKSLAEFLVANAIYTDVSILRTVFKDRNFSTEVPGVLHFFRQLVQRQQGSSSVEWRDPKHIKTALCALLNETEEFSSVTANAVSLLVSAGLSVHLDDQDEDLSFENIRLVNADLSRSYLAHISFKNAHLERCRFEGSQFIECNFSGAVFKNSFFGVTRPITKHSSPSKVTGLSFSPDGCCLASSTSDSLRITTIGGKDEKSISILSPQSNRSTKEMTNISVKAISYTPDGNHIAVGYSNGLIVIYSIRHNNQILNLGYHTDAVVDIKISTCGPSITLSPTKEGICEVYSASIDRRVVCWKLSPRRIEHVIKHDVAVSCLAITEIASYDNRDVRIVISASHTTINTTLRKYKNDIDSDSWVASEKCPQMPSPVTCMQLQPKDSSQQGYSDILIVGCRDGSVNITKIKIIEKQDIRKKKRLCSYWKESESSSVSMVVTSKLNEVVKHTFAINSLFAVSQYLITASDDAVIRIWDFRDPTNSQLGARTELRKLHGHKNSVTTLACRWAAVDSTGRTDLLSILKNCIASGSNMGDVFLWNVTEGSNRRLHGHAGSVTSASISSNGNYITSLGSDGTRRKWNAKNGKQESVSLIIKADHQRTTTIEREVTWHKDLIILRDRNKPSKVRMCFGTMERLSTISCTFDKSKLFGDMEILQMMSTGGKFVDPSVSRIMKSSPSGATAGMLLFLFFFFFFFFLDCICTSHN